MPGNARQAFPAKRRREEKRRQSYNTGRSGSLLHICFYAILLARAACAILRNHDLSARAPVVLVDELRCI